MNVLNERTPNSAAMRGISSICGSRTMMAWNSMSTRLPAATARCISPSTSMYESRVMTKGMSVVTPPVTAWRLSVAQSEANDWAALPRCRWVSRRPGMTKRPPASMVRRAGTVSPGRSTAAIEPSRIASPQSTHDVGLDDAAVLDEEIRLHQLTASLSATSPYASGRRNLKNPQRSRTSSHVLGSMSA